MKSQLNGKTTSTFGKKIIVTVITLLLILGATLFFMGRSYLKASQKPLNPHSSKVVQIRIPVGSSDRKIGAILQNRGVVRNGLVFNYYVKSHNIKNLQAGYYQLSPSMRLSKITRMLRIGGLRHPVKRNRR